MRQHDWQALRPTRPSQMLPFSMTTVRVRPISRLTAALLEPFIHALSWNESVSGVKIGVKHSCQQSASKPEKHCKTDEKYSVPRSGKKSFKM